VVRALKFHFLCLYSRRLSTFSSTNNIGKGAKHRYWYKWFEIVFANYRKTRTQTEKGKANVRGAFVLGQMSKIVFFGVGSRCPGEGKCRHY